MNIELLLKNNGKSLTKERKEIFHFLETQHLFSAQDVIDAFPKIGRASVFRTISLFQEIEIVRKLRITERGEVYEVHDPHDHHEHMKCQECDTILSFESNGICQKIYNEAKTKGFIIKQHSISILGICQTCSLGIP